MEQVGSGLRRLLLDPVRRVYHRTSYWKRKQEKREKARRKAQEKAKREAISCKLASIDPTILKQEELSFLLRFPVEIRDLIWAKVFDMDEIHIANCVMPCGAIRAFRYLEGNDCWMGSCNRRLDCGFGILSVFLSCQQFYWEAIRYFYSRAKFTFHDLQTFLLFRATIRREYFDRITFLRFDARWTTSHFDFPTWLTANYSRAHANALRSTLKEFRHANTADKDELWALTCLMVKKLPSLRIMTVHLSSRVFEYAMKKNLGHPTRSNDELILGPLLDIQGQGVSINVEVDWSAQCPNGKSLSSAFDNFLRVPTRPRFFKVPR
ncbi:hypothetical protein EJ04DRAFT_575134 [Polyplosphaeria fusca]|uniref:DUF7730 domain-containing protein n=1 Tax=Polyplosphaeria fusca TaxID=682080 RepID=A0A9P4R4M3_9PLEO|nr:hypothetical protein EJ04DRAFT_575134 [Polyplosphaeria fusca]